jgi:hypothetical protein
MASRKVVAFDIGIKNLAYGIVQENKHVVALENCNILEPIQTISCSKCVAKASLRAGSIPCCKRHIPDGFTVLPELLTKKIPSVTILKNLVKKHQCESVGTLKENYVEALSHQFVFPLEQPKQVNASKVSLETIHDALRRFVKDKWPLLQDCTHVLLENQPVFKNPHMKSVQVLLFATIREMFLQQNRHPCYQFIHAKKKVDNAVKGDEGYTERKRKSEERVKSLFEEGTVTNSVIQKEWQQAKKKSDMADALCMCIDFLSSNQNVLLEST